MSRAGRIVQAFVWCLCAMWAWSSPNEAEARPRIPIPIIWGHEQKMVDFENVLPPEVKAALPPELGANVQFAFGYTRVHIFWMDLWTWDGQFVLHNDKEYFELTPAMTAGIRERIGSAFPSVPWRYRFPLIPTILVALGAFSLVSRISFPSAEKRAARLLKDRRYQEAYHAFMDTMQKQMAAGGVSVGKARQRGMDAGVQYLMDHGVAEDTATKNLERIVEAAPEVEE